MKERKQLLIVAILILVATCAGTVIAQEKSSGSSESDKNAFMPIMASEPAQTIITIPPKETNGIVTVRRTRTPKKRSRIVRTIVRMKKSNIHRSSSRSSKTSVNKSRSIDNFSSELISERKANQELRSENEKLANEYVEKLNAVQGQLIDTIRLIKNQNVIVAPSPVIHTPAAKANGLNTPIVNQNEWILLWLIVSIASGILIGVLATIAFKAMNSQKNSTTQQVVDYKKIYSLIVTLITKHDNLKNSQKDNFEFTENALRYLYSQSLEILDKVQLFQPQNNDETLLKIQEEIQNVKTIVESRCVEKIKDEKSTTQISSEIHDTLCSICKDKFNDNESWCDECFKNVWEDRCVHTNISVISETKKKIENVLFEECCEKGIHIA